MHCTYTGKFDTVTFPIYCGENKDQINLPININDHIHMALEYGLALYQSCVCEINKGIFPCYVKTIVNSPVIYDHVMFRLKFIGYDAKLIAIHSHNNESSWDERYNHTLDAKIIIIAITPRSQSKL